MRFDVFSLLPEIFEPYLSVSILQKARQNHLIEVEIHNFRDWAPDKHHVTDDTPYGGGGGMVLKAPPIFDAIETVLGTPPACPVIMMTPQGRPLTAAVARELSAQPSLGILCGRYEGIDERIREHLITDQISIGDYVLTGGELPALILMDTIARFIPGVLGDPSGAEDDSFASGLLEYPHYTKPEEYRGWHVPDVLLSGNHAQIQKWRHEQALRRTFLQRPDLLENYPFSKADLKLLEELKHREDENPNE
jgi:tRNA (guanine-N1)-methyltransferase